jgi:vitamin B12 transporter
VQAKSPGASALTVSLFATLPFALAAGSAKADADAGATGLDQVVVTATRTEESVKRVASSITVLEAEAVRESQKTAVSDLLSTTPGVSVSRTGGLGSVTQLRIRGAESDQTAVLIDGVKLNDPSATGGGYNFGNLLNGDVSRIEVLRGPQSTLWGSQAIGGVVNIVTTMPQGPLSYHVSLEGGSRETLGVAARVEAGNERLSWRIGGNYLTTDGISSFDEDLGGKEHDGYRSIGWNARGVLKITDNISLDLRSTGSRNRADFDGFPAPTYDFADTREYGSTDESVSYAGVNVDAFGGRLHNRFGFAYTDTDRSNYDPASSVPLTFDASGSNKRWEYQGSFSVNDALQAVFGVESEKSEFTTLSPSEFEPRPAPTGGSVRIDSVYLQVQVNPFETLTLTAGVRHDDHDTFNGSTTAQAGAAWLVTESTLLRASYGEGFKAPTLYQLFSEYGTPDLRPEQAEGWDAGIEQHFLDGALVASVTYFERDTDNMIDFVSCLGNGPVGRCRAQPFGYYDNVQKAAADGVEFSLAAQIGERLSISGNYTNMTSENAVRGSANFGRMLARRPRETANAEVSYHWPIELHTTIAVERVGHSFDDAANMFRLDPYTLVGLRASYDVSDKTEVYGRIENLFDEDYATVLSYGSAGRGAFVGVRQAF